MGRDNPRDAVLSVELKDKAFFATDKNLMDTDEYNTMIESVDCIVINRQYSPHFMPLQGRSIIISLHRQVHGV